MSEECAVKKVTDITPEEVARVEEWINTEEYCEKNLAREAVVINPAHACQPLGAELVAHGFEGTLPFVHGSQGCASYYRSALTRHFREPAAAVADSMTEDGAVFGGQNNLHEGLENALKLYKPKMMAIFTSCMPEIIGDDLNAFIINARNAGIVPQDYPIPYANTPSFNGTHINGYDSMLKSVVSYLATDKKVEGKDNGKLNLIPGFDANTGNYREYKRICEEFGIPVNLLADISETFDSPLDGTYRTYPGGTPLEDAADSLNAHATLSMQLHATKETIKWFKSETEAPVEVMPSPIGVANTDAFLMKLSELFGKEVPASLKAERGRLVDAMTDAHQYLHNKKFAIWGDPDFLAGMISFLLEMGAKPYHVICSRGNKKVAKYLQALLDESVYGEGCKLWMNKDLWHLRSLVMTDPVDGLIGSTHGKFIARDANIPHIRLGFPILDRVNLHRVPYIGYQGTMNILTSVANTMLEEVDRTSDDAFFEMMR
ncbi:nitrogenase molybdenum-iron protein, beta chain [Syntrophotalea carbinolica DSM 2380]|uniref:Nitrogenase molybdenum-iron protein beta chain n=1 Tax=Syntrophotalea carbinolica (strain DSM 2380 / NBRC 103641 / GraBd1) TaxID=338963 RepID=Q3A2R7_SYNC1|nr:nitrogenase molybdenum-iron protein subunit beta [Syntrophotalea carbinolica]ABA89340.1 nitrogenase molybdenum-iron protein, beta chain [Syntrophotalea carbinolica DSM 2380]